MDLTSVLKKVNKDFGDTLLSVGVDKKSRSLFSLGSPGLDFCTYNSIPEGIFIELSGTEGSGKTLLSFLIASDYCKKEIKKPVEERRDILFVDCEGTCDPDWALTSTGYDMNSKDIKTLYFTPLGQSAEQIFDIIRECVQSGQVGLVIFDSLTAMASQQVAGESMEKKDMGTVAKVLADFIRRNTGLFMKYKTTFIGINGIIMNIGGYGNPETTGGGTYWKRACSLRLKVKRGAYFDDDGNELKSTAENPAGHVVETALLKSKFCRSDRKLGMCHLHYRKGIDLIWDTIDVATYVGLIDNSTQGIYKVLDPDTKEVKLDKDGNEVKIRGKKNIKPYFEEHLDEYKKLYDKVYEIISKKEDPNILSFEKMLNLNLQERFGITDDDEE